MSLQIERVGTLDKTSRGPQDYSQYTRLPYIPDPYSYTRRQTLPVMVGDVGVGGDNPIRVQSMTTTDTLDTAGTVAEAIRLVETGCEIVRITTPTAKDAENLKNIRAELERQGYLHVPLVADIHFNPNAAMEAAKWADKVRINPGNFADAKKFAILEYTYDEYQRELERIEQKFKPLLLRCKELGRSIRIGTNHGSLSDRIMNYYGDTPEGMVESAMEFALIAEKYGFKDLIFSMKASNPKVMIQAYRLLAARLDALGMNYPFHLGVTEAGNGEDGRIKSAIGIGSLLEDGIGDTIRVSLTEDPEHEIPVALRLARRYTPVEARLLEKAAIADATPVPVATEWPEVAADAPVLPDARQPYHFSKPETFTIQIGTSHVGGENVPQVSADLAGFPAEMAGTPKGAGRSLPVLGAKPKGAPTRPDFFEAKVGTILPENRAARSEPLNVLLNVEGGNLPATDGSQPDGFIVNISTPFADYSEGLTQVLDHATEAGLAVLVRANAPFADDRAELDAAAHHSYPAVDLLMEAARLAVEKGFEKLVLALSARTVAYTLRSNRLLATRLHEAGYKFPVQVIAPEIDPSADLDEHFINAAVATGALLTDGIGTVLKIANHDRGNLKAAPAVQLAYNILQAAGARSSKAEFIACPSCGRTLFNLQETTERIKARTGHLVGVKIAVMGCIVNGLGELADADFGYMGGAPGKVNLFVGKECLEKGVPTEQAVDRLVDLIKSHGRWIEPEAEEN
ncbi:MAG: (E)-4-hydroxy-3-methylbut-2-enyl-diphosphate synthase [Chloroflexi bacterium]|nr:(E)-4-hydroxy-3-methylbut-2-enyl-diphosphate synthase [Chloroflexota bacterium]